MKKKLLLHICCAPCSASAIKVLQDEYDISFYWYNPNIFDETEYLSRKEAAIKYAKDLGIKFFEEEYSYNYNNWKNLSLEQCKNCYEVRLKALTKFAKDNKFDYFSTSLLSSPYQKHGLIKELSENFAKQNNIEFVYKDFRVEFYNGKNELRNKGYYIQKYCGCNKSYKERFGTNKK